MNFKLCILPVLAFLSFSCSFEEQDNRNRAVINRKIQQQYQEIVFWKEQLEQDELSVGKIQLLANSLQKNFYLTGSSADLLQADSLLRKASILLQDKDAELLENHARMAIMQHKFREAYEIVSMAKKTDIDPLRLTLLEFDVVLELGQYDKAEKLLASYPDKTSFNYLIRKAKVEDHDGDLQTAINLMEKAAQSVRSRNPELYLWTVSNLADMYGHAGEIAKAKENYNAVLLEDPSNFHCLKGLAWIYWSHYKNAVKALELTDLILSFSFSPELHRLKSEIYMSIGNVELADKEKELFKLKMNSIPGSALYNSYMIEFLAEDKSTASKAVEIALTETRNRKTPEAYSLLAWALYADGQKAKAVEIMEKHVLFQTHEPDALMKAAIVLKDTRIEKARKLYQTCLEAEFELGPANSSLIRSHFSEEY